jgi:hypothetical protein
MYHTLLNLSFTNIINNGSAMKQEYFTPFELAAWRSGHRIRL